MVCELLSSREFQAQDLTHIGVATGPGSFAGTRVGVAFARGLALSTHARAVGVSSLSALALRADPQRVETVTVIHDARREELIWQIFSHGKPVTDLERGSVKKAREVIIAFGDVHLTGSGAVLLGADPAHFDPEPPLDALVARTLEAPEDAPPPSPVYARPPDATPSKAS